MNSIAKSLGLFNALLVGCLGGTLFYILQLPLPWLLGSLFGLLIVSNFSLIRIRNPKFLANPVRAILGTAIGAAFSPEIIQHIPQYLISLSLVIPMLVISIYLGYLYFERVAGLEKRTAFFCALPGGLIELMIICQSYGADVRRVVLIQTSRVLLIVYTIPFAIHHWTETDLSGRSVEFISMRELPLEQAILLLGTATLGWLLMKSLRLPGAAIVGPMLLSALVYSLGWVDQRMPTLPIIIAQLVLGTSIGCAFYRIQRRELIQTIKLTFGYFLLLMAVTMSFAYTAHLLTGIPLIAPILAFIPGGQAEMNVIAILVGVAVPYIALHHVLRMIIVMTIAPPLGQLILGKPQNQR